MDWIPVDLEVEARLDRWYARRIRFVKRVGGAALLAGGLLLVLAEILFRE